MYRHCIVVAFALVLSVVARPASVGAQEKPVEFSGEIKIGVHKLKLEEGTAYEIEVKGKDFTPNVNLVGAFISNSVPFGKEPNTFRTLFFPKETREYVLTVLPGFGNNPTATTLEYKASVRAMKLEEVFKKQDKLSANDPKYMNPMVFRNSPHKVYIFKMKAGQTYLIDMVRQGDNSRLDPYLYLENAKGNVVASDDDSGGFLNARILFRASEDGTYRIIASALSDTTSNGDFVLTVKGTKEK